MVVVAIGTRSNPLLTATAPDLKVNERGYIETDADGMTSIDGRLRRRRHRPRRGDGHPGDGRRQAGGAAIHRYLGFEAPSDEPAGAANAGQPVRSAVAAD